jgi:hypothetical protein
MKFEKLKLGDVLHYDNHYIAIYDLNSDYVNTLDCIVKKHGPHQTIISLPKSKLNWNNKLSTLSTKFIKSRDPEINRILIEAVFNIK